MENPNQNDDNNINVNLDEIIEESNNTTIETNEIDAIELRIQELEILIDQKEQEYFASENEELYDDYINLKNEYKSLLKKRKLLLKKEAKKDQSILEQVSIWIIIYGVITIILSLPILTGQLWLEFADKIIALINDANLGLSSEDFIYKVIIFLIIFAFPLLLNLITWIVHNNLVKNKNDKRVFDIFWIIQGLMSIGMIIYMSIKLYS